MARINLLAGDLAPKANIVRIVSILRTATVAGLVIFVVSVAGMISLFLINNQRLAASNNKQATLKSSIQGMASTEQQFYLLKDRLTYFGQIASATSAGGQLAEVVKLNSGMPPGAGITQVEITGSKVELTVSAISSSTLSVALRSVLADSPYKSIRLTNYSFSRSSGYTAAFVLTP